jgi:alanyl-tRNA synthetase
MQLNRDADGRVAPLPKPSIDTGAGLERLTAVLQGKISNFDTDLFQPLMRVAARLANVDPHKPEIQPSLRILADHARAATFLISDGVVPSNDGRGYVLRKIIRRALRHGKLLGAPSPLLAPLSESVRELMHDFYPELDDSAARTRQILDAEESRFGRTLDIGLKKLEDDLAALPEAESLIKPATYPGANAFRLYDTYGLPLDFIRDVLRDQGVALDEAGFDRAMQEQRTRARASWKGGHKDVAKPAYAKLAETFPHRAGFLFRHALEG